MEKEILCFENIHRNNNRIWMLNTVLANIGRLGKKRSVRTVRTMGVASLCYITYVQYMPCYNICWTCIMHNAIYTNIHIII